MKLLVFTTKCDFQFHEMNCGKQRAVVDLGQPWLLMLIHRCFGTCVPKALALEETGRAEIIGQTLAGTGRGRCEDVKSAAKASWLLLPYPSGKDTVLGPTAEGWTGLHGLPSSQSTSKLNACQPQRCMTLQILEDPSVPGARLPVKGESLVIRDTSCIPWPVAASLLPSTDWELPGRLPKASKCP